MVKFAIIIGKSGSGKSTLLSMLGAPNSGSVEVDDADIATMSARKRHARAEQ